MRKSNYTYSIDGRTIYIIDNQCDGYLSVTNNIENVLEEISKELNTSISNYEVIYKDTDGRIDGVHTKDGEFYDFYHIGETDYHAAKLKIKMCVFHHGV